MPYSKLIPIRFAFITWVPVFLIIVLENNLFTLALKLALILWVIFVSRASFTQFREALPNVAAGNILNLLWVTLMLLIDDVVFYYLFSFLVVLGFATMFKTIEDTNKHLQ